MVGPWRIAIAAAALAGAVVARGAGSPPRSAFLEQPIRRVSPSGAAWEQGPCELARADRRRTPSSACLACHDGSSGPAAGVAVQPSPRVGSFPRAPGDSMGHPVSVDYVQATMSRPHQYEPAMTLPVDVPLVNGRIECTTCHTGSSSAPRHVVDEQRLCSACHRM